MRGSTQKQVLMLSTLTPEQLVPADHPIRRIKVIVERALRELSPTFDAMYAKNGRASIPPERLLKGCLLIALYSVRSERQFCERLQYDLLFKWFLDMDIEDPAFDATTFTKNRDRLLAHEVAGRFFAAVLAQAKAAQLISAEHFTVDGTLLESWASLKSFQPRDSSNNRPRGGCGGGRNAEVEFRGVPRKNDTHVSTTDPDARLFTKGTFQPAKLYYSGNVLMENRHGLVMDVLVAPATGRAETDSALAMLHRQRRRGGGRRWTVAADKAYDTRDFVAGCREMRVTPQVAQNITNHRGSRVDGRTVSHRGYTVGQRRRKCVEEIFGWMKTVAGGRKLRYIGVERNQLWAEFTTSAYNLVRLAKLMPVTA
jgi:transposase